MLVMPRPPLHGSRLRRLAALAFLVGLMAAVLQVSVRAAAEPPLAAPNKAAVTHRLVVAVKTRLAAAAEKKLAVLVLVSQNGGAPSAAVATPRKPLTVLLDNSGLYLVKAEIDTSCKGSCAARSRISGAAGHKLEIVPTCQPRGSGFVCSEIKIVRVY